MARPNVSQNPTIPTQESPVQAGDVCGESWHYSVRVKQGRFSQNLEPLGELDLVSGPAPAAIQYAYDWMDSNAYDGILEQVKGEYESLDELIGGKNQAAIQTMIDRSDRYYGQAEDLRRYWDNDFDPRNLEGYEGLPLTRDDGGPGCADNSAGGIVTRQHYSTGEAGAAVSFTYCPTPEERELHTADRALFLRLIDAALRNLRCAQEAMWAVALYNRNKGSTRGSLALGYQQPEASAPVGASIAPGVFQAEPEIDLEPDYGDYDDYDAEAEEEEEAPPAKKGNMLLLVGAAAVAVLMFSKR